MSDFERTKDSRRKKFFSGQRDRENERPSRRNLYKFERDEKATSETKEPPMTTQPTILLKTREQKPNESRAVSPKRATGAKDNETGTTSIQIQKPKQIPFDVTTLWNPPKMQHSIPLIDKNFQFSDAANDFLMEASTDFLVVGILGEQGVGKSTILNLLTNIKLKNDLFNCVNLDNFKFDIETLTHIEHNEYCTQGVDLYITENRMILLDCQPFLSLSILNKIIHSDTKAMAAGDTIISENSCEIQSLQLASFLLSVCHVVILVQDWFFNFNAIKFLLTAEMLKPNISVSEEEVNENTPHLLLLHNRAKMEDFSPSNFKIMQEVYKNVFSKSKIRLDTGLGIGKGNILKSLCPNICGTPLNVFLLPEYIDDEEKKIYRGYPTIDELLKHLQNICMGASRYPLTHSQLNERNWLHFANKVWDAVKKNSFFIEYNKLLS